MVRIGINGFGRIGRSALRILMTRSDVEVVGINDLGDLATLAHLFQYDTNFGTYQGSVRLGDRALVVNGHIIPVTSEKDPSKLPWGVLGADVVLECTGRFTDPAGAALHIAAGAKRVVLSAPSKGEGTADALPTYIVGVNHTEYKGEKVVSNASCTTNCLAPVVKVIDEAFGIEKALMSTLHSYTADQNLQDGPHHDLRRARAAAENIVPTTTGAARAVTQVLPNLIGRFDGMAFRVPTPTVSLVDFTFVLKRPASVDEINAVLTQASKSGPLQGVLGVSSEPLVSSDYKGDSRSAIVDLGLTRVVGGDLVKVVAWYDNEWGYSARLVDLACSIGETLH
jgi:glyceraldehyde 3-phosphate dehydrogenase